MAKKKNIEPTKLLEHACILCMNRDNCSNRLNFPDDCDENDCELYLLDSILNPQDSNEH